MHSFVLRCIFMSVKKTLFFLLFAGPLLLYGQQLRLSIKENLKIRGSDTLVYDVNRSGYRPDGNIEYSEHYMVDSNGVMFFSSATLWLYNTRKFNFYNLPYCEQKPERLELRFVCSDSLKDTRRNIKRKAFLWLDSSEVFTKNASYVSYMRCIGYTNRKNILNKTCIEPFNDGETVEILKWNMELEPDGTYKEYLYGGIFTDERRDPEGYTLWRHVHLSCCPPPCIDSIDYKYFGNRISYISKMYFRSGRYTERYVCQDSAGLEWIVYVKDPFGKKEYPEVVYRLDPFGNPLETRIYSDEGHMQGMCRFKYVYYQEEE